MIHNAPDIKIKIEQHVNNRLKIKQHNDTIAHFIYFQVPRSNSRMNFTVNLSIKKCKAN